MSHMEKILHALHERIGLDAAQLGENILQKTIRKKLEKCTDLDVLLDPNGAQWRELVRDTLVPETWFFRNPEAFDALADWVRTQWQPHHEPPLRILSLPCATGEEPYSIAMTLLLAGLKPSQISIVAGDLGTEFLEQAEAGYYRQNSFRDSFNEERYGPFFTEDSDGRKRISKEIRDMVLFQHMNLLQGNIPPADIIFCRNVLIYFDDACQQHVVGRLGSALANDGVLFLGPVEMPIATRCGFDQLDYPMAFVCRKAPRSPRNSHAAATKHKHHRAQKKKKTAPSAKTRVIRSMPKKEVSPQESPPSDSPERVRELANAGRLGDAVEMAERVIEQEAPSAELYCLCGTVQEALKHPRKAEQLYRQALFLEPNHTETLMHLGLLLEVSGRTEAAAVIRRRIKS